MAQALFFSGVRHGRERNNKRRLTANRLFRYPATGMSGKPLVTALIQRFGGQTALARAVGRSQGTIWAWVVNGRVPPSSIEDVIAAAARLDPPMRLEPNDFFEPR